MRELNSLEITSVAGAGIIGDTLSTIITQIGSMIDLFTGTTDFKSAFTTLGLGVAKLVGFDFVGGIKLITEGAKSIVDMMFAK